MKIYNIVSFYLKSFFTSLKLKRALHKSKSSTFISFLSFWPKVWSLLVINLILLVWYGYIRCRWLLHLSLLNLPQLTHLSIGGRLQNVVSLETHIEVCIPATNVSSATIWREGQLSTELGDRPVHISLSCYGSCRPIEVTTKICRASSMLLLQVLNGRYVLIVVGRPHHTRSLRLKYGDGLG